MSYRGKDSGYVVVSFGHLQWLHYRWRWGTCHFRLGDSSWHWIIGSTYRDKGCLIMWNWFHWLTGLSALCYTHQPLFYATATLCSSYMHSHFNHIYMYILPQSAWLTGVCMYWLEAISKHFTVRLYSPVWKLCIRILWLFTQWFKRYKDRTYWVKICSAGTWGGSQETYYRSSGCIYGRADGHSVGLAEGKGCSYVL
jgi:hypothetical protein